MSSRPIFELRSAAVRSTTALPHAPMTAVISICDSPAYDRSVRSRQRENREDDGLNPIRGVCSAFLFQGGFVLLCFGVWQLWRWIH